MAGKTEGFSYAPAGKPGPVVKRGEFLFAATHLNHAHIHGMCTGLIEAGAVLRFVYDPDPVNFPRSSLQARKSRFWRIARSD